MARVVTCIIVVLIVAVVGVIALIELWYVRLGINVGLAAIPGLAVIWWFSVNRSRVASFSSCGRKFHCWVINPPRKAVEMEQYLSRLTCQVVGDMAEMDTPPGPTVVAESPQPVPAPQPMSPAVVPQLIVGLASVNRRLVKMDDKLLALATAKSQTPPEVESAYGVSKDKNRHTPAGSASKKKELCRYCEGGKEKEAVRAMMLVGFEEPLPVCQEHWYEMRKDDSLDIVCFLSMPEFLAWQKKHPQTVNAATQ